MSDKFPLGPLERVVINFFTPVDALNNYFRILPRITGNKSMYHNALKGVDMSSFMAVYSAIANDKNDKTRGLFIQLYENEGKLPSKVKRQVVRGICANLRYQVAKSNYKILQK